MRRAASIPRNAFPRLNKEVVLLPDSGTNVPRGFVPQCLKPSYFNFRPYKLKMSPKLITLLFWIRVCGWQHLLETQLCFLIKEPSLLDEKKSSIQRELEYCENNQIIFLHKYSPWEKEASSENRASQPSLLSIYSTFYYFLHFLGLSCYFPAEDPFDQLCSAVFFRNNKAKPFQGKPLPFVLFIIACCINTFKTLNSDLRRFLLQTNKQTNK